MKAKGALLILIVVVLGLGIGLIVLNQQATQEKKQADDHIARLSNDVVAAHVSLEDARSVNMVLTTNLAKTTLEYSNKLSVVESNLATTTDALLKSQSDSKAAAEAAALAISERDKKIADLETQNQALDKASIELRTSITNLESQITVTQHKLETSEGERSFLLGELKRLQAEKADLEKKFNDLAVLRAQVKKIKEEISISRRLDWVRRGIYGSSSMKGAERMMHPPNTLPPSTNDDRLNVELRQDGQVKIVPVSSTNAPATK